MSGYILGCHDFPSHTLHVHVQDTERHCITNHTWYPTKPFDLILGIPMQRIGIMYLDIYPANVLIRLMRVLTRESLSEDDVYVKQRRDILSRLNLLHHRFQKHKHFVCSKLYS